MSFVSDRASKTGMTAEDARFADAIAREMMKREGQIISIW